MASVSCIAGCLRDLDLAHKYDNSTSKEPYEEQEDDVSNYSEFDKWYLSDRYDINVEDEIPRKGYWLDGKITVVKFSWAAKFSIFWSADRSLMQSDCDTPWLEYNINRLSVNDEVIGDKPTQNFTDGGQWFIGVHELKGKNGKLVGFFHAESHWPGKLSAYKSIGVAYSDDMGKTWTKGNMILSGTDPRPETGANDTRSYGLGDGCIVYNEERESWICYYCGSCTNAGTRSYMISMAESKDPEGKAGTWKKWDGFGFTAEGCNGTTGLGGANYTIDELKKFPGGNPSVMYNTYLNKWIMVYHSWNRAIIYSESEDGINWTKAVTMISKTMEPGGAMYPNLIGPDGDTEGGKQIRMYYSTDMDGLGIRTLSCRRISFK